MIMCGDAYITNGMGENVLMNDDINQQAGEGAVGTWGPKWLVSN